MPLPLPTTTKSEPLPWTSRRAPAPGWTQSRPEPPIASPAKLLGAAPWPPNRLVRSDPGTSPLVQVMLPLTGVGVLDAPATLDSSAAGAIDGSFVLPWARVATTPITAAVRPREPRAGSR